MNTSAAEIFIAKDELAFINAAIDHPLERSNDGWISGYFYNCRLSSVFQPVFNPVKGKIMGHAAYIRSESCGGETALSPWHVFSLASKDPQLISLDYLSRIVHALNYFNKTTKLDKLFISAHPQLLENTKDDYGHALKNLLDLIGVRTTRVVIEIPVRVNRSWKLFRRAIINYRARGFQIAANCSGSNNDWMAGLGSLYPDIVRITAGELLRRNTPDSLVDKVHCFGATLLVRNIETSEQVAAAINAGADYLQGNFLGNAVRAIEMAPPQQLSEKFNAERWRRLVSLA